MRKILSQLLSLGLMITLLLPLLTAPAGAAPSANVPSPETQSPEELHGPAAQPVERLEIRLQRATFDPLYETPTVPPDLALSAYPGDGSGYYLVQFHGPILPEWKEALQQKGAVVHDYVPQFAYVVRMDDAAAASIRALDEVRWVGLYQPAFRLSTGLDGLVASAEPGETARIVVRSFSGEPAEMLAEQLKSLGADVRAVGRDTGGGTIFKMELPPASIPTVAQLGGVAWVEPWAEPRLYNEITRGPLIFDKDGVEAHLGLYGAGQIVVVGDTGVSTGNEATMHPDFRGHFYKGTWGGGTCGTWEDYYAHGTHVAGSVLGSGVMDGAVTTTHSYAGTNAGIAPEALLWAWGFCSDWSGLPDTDPYNDYYGVMYNDDPRVRINTNSWGYDTTPGTYNAFSRETDRFLWDHPDMVVLFAASNDGVDDDADGIVDDDSMGVPAGAKNIITVGASENYRMSGGYNPGGSCSTYGGCWPSDYPANPVRDDRLSDDPSGMVAYSSRGPVKDGRLKPDVVAPGSNVVSARYQGGSADPLWGVYNDWYSYCGGTSMATPLAAGASAIVREFYTVTYGIDPIAALVKATLINGAYDMTPGQYRDEDPTGAHDDVIRRPDINQGWGRIDLRSTLVYTLPHMLWFDEHTPGLSTGQVYSTSLTVTGAAHPLRITLAWSDYPGTEATHGALVNDLDLEVVAPGGATYYGNDIFDGLLDGDVDHTNNVEGIDFAAPAPGTYLIRVRAYNIPQSPQPFALVVSGDMGAVGYLDGTVHDGTLGGGLEGATVRAITGTVEYHATTGASGYYTTPVAADTYTVSAWKYGYTLETITDVVVLSGTVATRNFTLTQTALYTLTGCITDSVTGDPLPATVSVVGPFGDPITQTAAPQATGCYTFTLHGGPYTVTAEARLHRPGESFVNLVSDTVQNFALDATTTNGILWGHVTSLETSNSLEGATIQVTPGLTITQSASDGYYEMQLPHDVYTVTVSAPLYETQVETNVTVPRSNLTEHNYALGTSHMVLLPSGGLSVTLRLGEQTTATLTISNTGSGGLEFESAERTPGFTPLAHTRFSGGPDPYGYTYADSSEPDGPLFEWVDATDGTPLGLSDDGETNVTLPFTFNFYGDDSTDLRVGNNGGLLFNATSGDLPYTNASLDTTSVSNLIVPFWDDIDEETGDVYYKTVGTAPHRRFVVEWYDRPHYKFGGGAGNATFELILYERTNNIKFQYQDVVFGDTTYPYWDYGGSATVGIRQTGSNYLQYSYNTAVLTDGLSICFQYPGSPPCDVRDVPWLSENPISGTVAAGEVLGVEVGFDASVPDVDHPGKYTAVLRFYTNDPEAQPYMDYPVTMTVLPPPPEFTIGKIGSAETVEVGLPLTYTIVVTNTGGPATGVVVSDTLPEHTQFAWAGDGGTLTGGDVVWSGLSVAAGDTLTLTFGVTVTCVSSGTQIINDDYRVYASEWPTPTVGAPVTVTAIAEGVMADFAFSPTPVLLNWPVAFTNLSHNGTSYEWDFGDGHGSYEANPSHTYTGPTGGYTVVLTAANVCNNDVVSHPLTVEDYAVTVSPTAASSNGDPGEVVTYTLRVTNTGTLSDTFEVTAGGNDWPTQLSTDTLVLDAGDGVAVTVVVTIPVGTAGGAQDSVLITVRSLSDPRTPPASASAALTTTANTVYGVALGPATASQVASPGQTVTYTMRVTNTGNAPDTIVFTRTTPGWLTSFSDSSVALSSGEWALVEVCVTVPVTATDGLSDTAVIRATGSGGYAEVTLTTTVAWHKTYLPLVVRNYP
ncbi:MAG TPA: DUF11 domain-containing protein [Chloroflexi bacterium]|nr:DUF11 domain-containing protein [Chloroflexota bacterium]